MMLARPVYGDNRSVLGVVAKELSLKPLREYLQALSIDRHGLAFVAESNGNLVVSSNGDGVFGASLSEPGKKVRFNVQDAGSSLMQQSWKLVQKYLQQHPDTEAVGDSAGSPGASLDQPRPLISGSFSSEFGQIEVVAQIYRDAAGLDWVAVVALPRSDFSGAINSGVYKSLYLGLLVILLALLFGYAILG